MSEEKALGMRAESGRWLFVVLGFVINLCLGSVYAYSVFKEPVALQFNRLAAEQANPDIKELKNDLLGKVFGLKDDGPKALKEAYALAPDDFAKKLDALFKLDPKKDAGKAAEYAGALKKMTPEELDKLLATKKITSMQSSLPFMTFLAFFSILMFFGGKIMEKIGPRKLAIIGGIVVGAGWFLSSFATNLTFLIITYGVIAGSGVGLVYGCPVAMGARWFPDRKGLAVGLMLAGFGGSALLTAKIADVLIASVGLMSTFMYFGIAFAIIIVLLALSFRFPTLGWKPEGWTPKAGSTAAADFTTGEMAKTGAFWGLFLCYIIGCLAGLMAIGISKPVGGDIIKIASATATMLVGVFAIFNAVGRPVFGALTDKMGPKGAAVLNLVILLGVSLIMIFGAKEGTTALYVVAFAGFWLCLGGWLAIAPAATATFFGVKNNARNYGTVFFAYGLGAIIGGIIAGQAKDVFGSYTYAFYPTAGLAVVGIVLALLLLKAPKKAA